MLSPLELALDAVRIATEAVTKARNFYDWQEQGSPTSKTVRTIESDLITAQQQLKAIINA